MNLTQEVDYGTHCDEITAPGDSPRTTGWTANVQVRNNVRGGIAGSEGPGRTTERFDL